MRTKSLCHVFLLYAFLVQIYLHNGVIASQDIARSESEALEQAEGSKRETLEIIIGGGSYAPAPAPAPSPQCPPPPPPPCPPPPQPPLSRLDKARLVLLNFTKFIDDPKGYTKNWNQNNKDTCKFNGIRCDTYPNTNEKAVAGIDLNQAGMSGLNKTFLSLSGILDRIPELTFFHVNSNNFSGSIPNQITKFPFFYELDISNNKLVGEFPKQVLQAFQLVFLDLRFNYLYGPLPPQLFQLPLDFIFINNNQFSQCLPDNFGSTPARYLTFANNQFLGPIPRSIGNASKTLTEVLFLGNKFEGCLPYEIGYLKKATVFDVSKNELTGPIPLSFACLEKIQFLNLAHNKFYGSVPEIVCQLPGLRNNGNLSLSDNYFTEVGPECQKLIKSNVLNVNNNCIPGFPNQRSYNECYKFSCTVKSCPNEKYLSYIPCKGPWGQSTTLVSEASPSPPDPVTYKSLKPHRLRL
ncbi:hypothetical protein Lal_00016330 [Lupinus albus]|uniref:Cell wall hydroxyproline-rich glycoprotein n=1 Tax=Lupinus albus TaxID=3870 RepID=A0A6A5MMU6_LUPAL|nr:putative leucine-rich repeat-containing, plant-type, leucine-rich repeat domain, L [Lupinus albus]KAF1873193.1 hypothetical protein Lal_00016330 [Lupinus albus]